MINNMAESRNPDGTPDKEMTEAIRAAMSKAGPTIDIDEASPHAKAEMEKVSALMDRLMPIFKEYDFSVAWNAAFNVAFNMAMNARGKQGDVPKGEPFVTVYRTTANMLETLP